MYKHHLRPRYKKLNLTPKQRLNLYLHSALLWFSLMLGVSWADEGITQSNEPTGLVQSIATCNQLEDQDPGQAVSLGLALLQQLDRNAQAELYGKVLGCLGWSYASLDRPENARIQAIQLEQLANQLSPSEDSVMLSRRAGSVFHRIGDRVSASDNYAQAMRQAESLQSPTLQIPILVNLGVLNSELREHSQAIENYYQALELMSEADDFKYQPPVLFNLAATLNGQKRFTEGLRVFQQVEAMVTEQWPATRTAQVYAGLAAAHSGLKDYELAEEYALKSMQLLADSDNKFNDYYSIMSTLAALKSYQGEFDEAKVFADQVKAHYTKEENNKMLLGSTNPLFSLALTYERIGDLPVALKMHKLATQLEREIQDTFNQQTMAQMQTRLNDSKQREELTALKNDRIKDQIVIEEAKHNSELLWLAILAVVVLLMVSIWWYQLTNRKLKKMAMTDSLTELGNRRAIIQWVKDKPLKSTNCRYLWLIDLDRFKQVNDEYDHDVGDYALQQIAKTLSGLENKNRFAGRWGGEEFMLVTDDLKESELGAFAKKLLLAIENTDIKHGSAHVQLTASVGFSKVSNDQQSNISRAMYQADKALYTAKERGRNCAVMATNN